MLPRAPITMEREPLRLTKTIPHLLFDASITDFCRLSKALSRFSFGPRFKRLIYRAT